MIRYLSKILFFKRLIPSIIKIIKIKKINFYNNDLIFNLDMRYLIDRRFYLNGSYDDEKIRLFNYLIKNYEIENFFDIGSCWGIYSLMIAKKNSLLKIKSFDVFNNNCDRLKQMAKINNLNNIEVINVALGARDEKVIFSVNESFSPNYAKDLNGKYVIEVNQKKLDNLVSKENEKIAIKMDVERTEIDVLSGAKNILLRNKCFVQIEYGPEYRNKIDNFFKDINYKKIIYEQSDDNECFFSNFIEQKDINL